jgi:hypothetical protein
MNIKWENNSRVQRLYAEGKINQEDIIKRTQTDNFPMEAATVRLAKVKEKNPNITIHIRGPKEQTKSWNGNAFEYAITCRVNFGGTQWRTNTANMTMNSNGELHQDYDWQDVHNVVTRVKEVMDIN